MSSTNENPISPYRFRYGRQTLDIPLSLADEYGSRQLRNSKSAVAIHERFGLLPWEHAPAPRK
jgi:hypothetical protein